MESIKGLAWRRVERKPRKGLSKILRGVASLPLSILKSMEKQPVRYQRDMRGYGRNPPNPDWPGGAHVCVQFVLNYEEGGENCILHEDAASEAFLSEIVG